MRIEEDGRGEEREGRERKIGRLSEGLRGRGRSGGRKVFFLMATEGGKRFREKNVWWSHFVC